MSITKKLQGVVIPAAASQSVGAELYIGIDNWSSYIEALVDRLGIEKLNKLIVAEPAFAALMARITGEVNPTTGEVVREPLDETQPAWLLGSVQMSCRRWRDARIQSWSDALSYGQATRIHDRRRTQAAQNLAAWRVVAAQLGDTVLATWLDTAEANIEVMLAKEGASIEEFAKAQQEA